MKEQFVTYIKALNDHDIDKALSLLSEEFQLHFTEYDFKIDKKGMMDVLGWDKGVNGVVSYENLVVEKGLVSALFTERNEFFKLTGIDALRANIIYGFDDNGLIVSQAYTPLPNQPSFQEKMQPAVDWARKNRPDELSEIYPQNQIKFDQEMGERWVALLREWHKATKDREI